MQRITLVNTDLDLSWSVDMYKGEDAKITGVIGRSADHFKIIRNTTTLGIFTMFGYGISVYDMRAIDSNDAGLQCGDTSTGGFHSKHANFCDYLANRLLRIPEKVINTPADGSCGLVAAQQYPPEAIQNVTFSAESVGLMPAHKDNSGGTVYDKLRMFGLDPRKGVLDMTFPLPTEAGAMITANGTNGCVTRSNTGLVLYDFFKQSTPRAVPRLQEIEQKLQNTSFPLWAAACWKMR